LKRLPLTCPCENKSPLVRLKKSFICNNNDCNHSSEIDSFPIFNDIPVLISEKKTDTVCQVKFGKTYVDRSSSKVTYLKKIIKGVNKITENNCEKFVKKILSHNKKPKVLVIGGGEKGDGTRKLWKEEKIKIHSIDIYRSENVDIVCDAHYLPLQDGYYDGVWIQAVLEHVVEPHKVVNEIHRVLKKDGLVYAETPFLQPVHEGAYDFTRYTVLGHRYLFKNFKLLGMGGMGGPEKFFASSFKYLIWSITRSKLVAKIFGLILGIFLRPISLFTNEASIYDASSGVYFFGKKNNKININHKDLISLYKGQM
jgi:SAM-dependent methyltransferase